MLWTVCTLGLPHGGPGEGCRQLQIQFNNHSIITRYRGTSGKKGTLIASGTQDSDFFHVSTSIYKGQNMRPAGKAIMLASRIEICTKSMLKVEHSNVYV